MTISILLRDSLCVYSLQWFWTISWNALECLCDFAYCNISSWQALTIFPYLLLFQDYKWFFKSIIKFNWLLCEKYRPHRSTFVPAKNNHKTAVILKPGGERESVHRAYASLRLCTKYSTLILSFMTICKRVWPYRETNRHTKTKYLTLKSKQNLVSLGQEFGFYFYVLSQLLLKTIFRYLLECKNFMFSNLMPWYSYRTLENISKS